MHSLLAEDSSTAAITEASPIYILEEFRNQLIKADSKIRETKPEDIPVLFDRVPLEVFGAIQIERPDWIPQLNAWLPTMPPDDVQEAWTSSSGHALLKASVSFVRILSAAYAYLTARSLRVANVLDFGCGWGRMIRLLYKYVPTNQLYGVDPLDASLAICSSTGMHGTFLRSDFIPRSLPTPGALKFDLIIAFSIFTHFPEKLTKTALNTLADQLTLEGLLAITIRPREYWPYIQSHNPELNAETVKHLLAQHDKREFAFDPHDSWQFEGETTFGDTSMTMQYLEDLNDRLNIVGAEWSAHDPLQVIVFMRQTA